MPPTPLSELLRDCAAPRPGDATLEMLRRAEMGVRLVAATCAAVLADSREPPAGVATAARQWLERTGMFGLGRTTQVVLKHLENTDAPIAGWAALLHGRVDARSCRPVDRWLTDYESTLRHAGRNPPRDTMDKLDAAFRRQLGELLRRLDELIGDDVTIAGEGEETVVAGLPSWPLLCRTGANISVWDRRQGKRRGRWLDLRTRDSWFAPIDPGALGVLTALERVSRGAVLAAFCGTVERANIDDKRQARVFIADEVSLVVAMDELVNRYRAVERPVVAAFIDDSTSLVDALSDAVTPGEPHRLREAVASWHDETGQMPVFIVASDALDAGELRSFYDSVAGGVHLWGITRSYTVRRWDPESRRAVSTERYDRDLPPGEPPAVAARLHAGVDELDAWVQGAKEHFGLTDTDKLRRMLTTLSGETSLIGAAEEGMLWWQRGDVSILADGRPKLVHPGWRELVAGLRGEEPNGDRTIAWEAGARLAAALREATR